MTEKAYNTLAEFFKKRPFFYRLLGLAYKYLPAIVFVFYVIYVALALLFTGFFQALLYELPLTNDITVTGILKTILVPLGAFIVVSIFRKIFNFQRPYEKYNITPLIPKDKKGHSFPSRHTASGFIIGMAFLYVNTILGVIFLSISLLIAITRVISGVHFIKDVIAGAFFSIIIGWIFLFII